jgi:hypothetical protein
LVEADDEGDGVAGVEGGSLEIVYELGRVLGGWTALVQVHCVSVAYF